MTLKLTSAQYRKIEAEACELSELSERFAAPQVMKECEEAWEHAREVHIRYLHECLCQMFDIPFQPLEQLSFGSSGYVLFRAR